MKILRPCLKQGCSNLATDGYCDEHHYIREEQQRRRQQTYNQHRPEHHAWYRSDDWERVRKRQLAEHPLCQDCEAKGRIVIATEVHHVEKVANDKQKRLDRSNLMSLCKSCHSKRTARGE